MASLSDWALFFTGSYSLLVDGEIIEPAIFTFSPAGALRLEGSIRSLHWNEEGACQLDLKTGFITGNMISYEISDPIRFFLKCWELVRDAQGACTVGFNPSGLAYVRWEGRTEGTVHNGEKTLQFDSIIQKQRPDRNFPWNLPPYGPR